MQDLIQLFKQWCGHNPTNIESLPKAGSNRRYVRFTCPPDFAPAETVVGVVGTSREENDAFIYLSQHFREKELPVPEILAVSSDGMRYLQTDLGKRSLYDALSEGRQSDSYSRHEISLIKKTIQLLPKLQVCGANGLDFNRCQQTTPFDETAVMFDLNYFKYCFLKTTELDHNELRLEQDFRQLAKDLVAEDCSTFLYRDFQARNVMLTDGEAPYFIDYQGGRRGPIYYDVVSFLWQASARYSDALRSEMQKAYLEALSPLYHVDENHFKQRLQLFALFRVLQVLGTYGFRGYFERKRYFIDSIPPALDNLRQLLAHGAYEYPYLSDTLSKMCDLPMFHKPLAQNGKPTLSPFDNLGELKVRIFSFSFHKGIPEDESGNGGGYVFDCRSTHNPGRYAPYKHLTGLDTPVIKFLEDDGEILTFLDPVYKLADAHVKRYLERGFTDLMFSFGCTGGQHRSVYCAEHLAHHLNDKFGIEVRIHHREQGIQRILKARRP